MKPGALTIYTIHPGGNFSCKYSVLQLFQTQNGKIRKCISINCRDAWRKGKLQISLYSVVNDYENLALHQKSLKALFHTPLQLESSKGKEKMH